jgi:phage pi2 protein 07
MDSTAIKFRDSCLEILKFLSSPAEQKEFASKVEYIDYKSEFACWWFDDLVMESLPKGTGLISQSFNESEKFILWEFTQLFDQIIDSQDLQIDELLKNPQWRIVIDAAQVAFEKLV